MPKGKKEKNMKEKRKIAILLAVVLLVLATFAGCGRAKAKANPGPLIDAELTSGELTIYVEGEGFDRWYHVIDYVKGDPAGIAEWKGLDPIYGIFVILDDGSDEPANMAIFRDGDVRLIDTQFKLLPRAGYNKPYNFGEFGGASMILTLNCVTDSKPYNLLVKGVGQAPIEVHGIDDAGTADDTVYWLKDGDVYSLDWQQPDARPRAYFRGANAVSHGSDESEGALVPLKYANYEAYGRSDIYSPYGTHVTAN